MFIFQTTSTGSDDTEQLGEILTGLVELPLLIELKADLGGGKTTLVKGIARGLKSAGPVSSPTFTVMKAYKGYLPDSSHLDVAQGDNELRASRTKKYGKRGAQADDAVIRQKPAGAGGSAVRQGKAMREVWIHHFDFYRLPEAGVMKDQLAESIADNNVLTIVEWSDVVRDVLPKERITIELKPTANDPDERELIVTYPENLADIVRNLEQQWGRSEP